MKRPIAIAACSNSHHVGCRLGLRLRFGGAAARGDGAHQYHFANDLSWSAGPGYYFVRNRHTIVGLQCACSGEHKGLDRFQGQPAEDTGITAVYLGPRVVASFGKISGELAVELPVSIDNTALQVVPDYRLHASVAIRF